MSPKSRQSTKHVAGRLKIDAQLPVAEEMYRTIFENSAVAITVTDENENIVYWNRLAEVLLGMDREDLHMKPVRTLYPAEEWKRIRARNIRQKGMQHHFETKIIDKNEEIIDVDISVSVLKAPDGKVAGSIGILTDITEKKKSEEALRRSEEYFRALIENALDVIMILNSDGSIRYESPSIENITGYKPKEREGKSVFDLIHPDDMPKAINIFSQVLKRENASVHTEFGLQHKDGSWRVIEGIGTNLLAHPVVAGIVANFRDITERKQAEEALKASEERHRLVVENAKEAILVAQDGMIKFFNSKGTDIIGHSREELLSKPFAEFIHPDDQQMVIERHFKRMEGVELPNTYPFRIFDKDGNIRWLEISAVAIVWEGRPATLNFLSDVTERKQAEEEVVRLSNAFKMATDAITIIDIEGKIVDINEAVLSLYGMDDRSHFIGKNALDFVAPEDKEKAVAAMGQIVEKGYLQVAEYHVTHSDGRRVPVEASGAFLKDAKGEPMGFVAIMRDITERKQAEQALRESEEKYRTILEDIEDGYYEVDIAGNFTFFNDAICEIIGYPKDEMMDMNNRHYMDKENAQRVYQAFNRVHTTGKHTKEFGWELIRKDGTKRFVETSVSLKRNSEGETIGFRGIVRDITERKRSEEEKQRMEQQLQLTGRLAAVGQLAAGVAHELNNPLAAVQGFSQFLASREDLDQNIRGDVETIYKEAVRATKITANLLSFARKHEPEKSLISINDVIEESLELHAYRMRVNNIEIPTDLDPKLPTTMADFHQMQQVFVNLITNAEQAMTEAHGKGKLRIKTHRVNDIIQATFTDDGPGITDDNLGRIFDPFFTTKDVGKGTGLGLSICYGIVQEHGGRLFARSKPGEGATFVVELPIISEAEYITEQTDPIQHQNI